MYQLDGISPYILLHLRSILADRSPGGSNPMDPGKRDIRTVNTRVLLGTGSNRCVITGERHVYHHLYSTNRRSPRPCPTQKTGLEKQATFHLAPTEIQTPEI